MTRIQKIKHKLIVEIGNNPHLSVENRYARYAIEALAEVERLEGIVAANADLIEAVDEFRKTAKCAALAFRHAIGPMKNLDDFLD